MDFEAIPLPEGFAPAASAWQLWATFFLSFFCVTYPAPNCVLTHIVYQLWALRLLPRNVSLAFSTACALFSRVSGDPNLSYASRFESYLLSKNGAFSVVLGHSLGALRALGAAFCVHIVLRVKSGAAWVPFAVYKHTSSAAGVIDLFFVVPLLSGQVCHVRNALHHTPASEVAALAFLEDYEGWGDIHGLRVGARDLSRDAALPQNLRAPLAEPRYGKSQSNGASSWVCGADV